MTSAAPAVSRDASPDAFAELFASATQDASNAVARWTGNKVTMCLDQVTQAPLEEALETFAMGADLLTMVGLTLDPPLGGVLLLAFDEQNGRQLAATLLGRAKPEGDEWTDLERSALNETGNILGCAYVHSLADAVKADLTPSPPQFMQDFAGSVLGQALLEQAMESDTVLVCQTRFFSDGETLQWQLFFLPSPALTRALEEVKS